MYSNLKEINNTVNLKEQFYQVNFKNSLVFIRWALVLGFSMYGLFAYLDYSMVPDNYNAFWLIRFVIVLPLILMGYVLTFHQNAYRILHYFFPFLTFVAGYGIIAMIMMANPPVNYVYYAGLILVIIFNYTLLKIRFWLACLSGWLVLLGYEYVAFSFGTPLNIILSNNFFFVSANLLGMFTAYSIEKSNWQQYYTQIKLDREKRYSQGLNEKLEQKVEERTEELEETNEKLLAEIDKVRETELQLTIAKEKAEESDKLKSAFLTNMSHEIRVPMNNIIGYTELLQNFDADHTKKSTYLSSIKKNGRYLLSIINDIIDLSKLETMQIDHNEEEIDLNELFESIERETRKNNLFAAKPIQLKVFKSFSNRNARVFADYFKIRRVLSNLMDNAVKFTNKGNIELGYTLSDQSTLLFYIMDTGIGVPMEKQDYIFDRFTRIHSPEESNYPGTGLGLAICKEIVSLLDGEVSVQSKPGEGSTFFFTIPYKPVDLNKGLVSMDKLPESDFLFKGKEVLVVEDDTDSCLFLKEVLQDVKANVYLVSNGSDAIDVCRNKLFDIILMDVQTPGINGFEATKQIKLMYPDVPIILQSAFTLKEDVTKGFNCGCDDYIVKPIDQRKLIAKMNRQFWKRMR